MSGPGNSSVRAFGMNLKAGGSSPPWVRHFLSQKLPDFVKNNRLGVENECYCLCPSDFSNINFTNNRNILHVYVDIFVCCLKMCH